jgi:GNAT superfamily N-acetyltransferase
MRYIQLTPETLPDAHICCAFSDKKCATGYQAKKDWLAAEFDSGYVFSRLDERAKVFIEYGPAEHAWVPVDAPHYLVLGCFWVSGQYKSQGHGKALLQQAVDAAKAQGKSGIVAVVGQKKYHFMSDTKWLLNQGFEVVDSTPAGFALLALKLDPKAKSPQFAKAAKSGDCPETKGLVAYYSNRCPFTELHVTESLVESAKKRGLPLKLVKLESAKQAQAAPTPATIFSLFYKGKFFTTDLSACMDSRFDKVVQV